MTDRVLVVGGGIAGLAAARRLALAGVPVTLAEAGPKLGGKVATERVDGFTIEGGPDAFLTTKAAAIALARELGLADELIATKDPRAVFVLHRGQLLPMPEGLGLVLPTRAMPFLRTPLFSWPEKLRMAKDLVAPRMLPDEDVTVGSFLRRRLGSPLVDRLAGPLVGGVYGTPVDELSLDAVVPQLRTAEREHRSLLRAGLADGPRMRRAMAARAAEGTSLGAFASLHGGMGTLIVALASALEASGAEVRLGLGVRALARTREGNELDARFGDGSTRRFGGVVVATPAPVVARLVEGELPSAARALSSIPHGSAIVVTLAFPRDRVAHPLVGHGYLVPAGEGGAISACTWTSEKWPGRAPDGTVLLRMFIRDDPTWTAMPDEALAAAALDAAGQTLGITGDRLLVRVARWASSMPRYTVGHLGRVTRIEAEMAAWPSVALAGASYRGVGLSDCIEGGRTAAEQILGQLSRPPAPLELAGATGR